MLAAALFVSPAAAQDATLVLQPSTNWQLDYADDSCRLARQFGEGEDRVAFYIERYQPGDSFFLLVAGKPLRARNPHAKGVIRFGPDGAEATHWQTGQLGEFDPALLVNSMWVRYIPRDPDAPRAKLPIDAVRNSLDPATEAAITWLEVKRGSDRVVRLALGSMGEPLAAMRSCTDDLLKHWGVDIEAHRSLSRAVTPKSDPTRWVRTSDYPPDLAGSGEQGSGNGSTRSTIHSIRASAMTWCVSSYRGTSPWLRASCGWKGAARVPGSRSRNWSTG
ncbi:hypothetical protein J4558_05890 [Leptolyngbya sp. 15MV]|nr:hypothetical protein J4558_05890 [Leptolyngbya sp. 15MV]